MIKKLSHLSKSQKNSLAILSFVVLVLPISLVFIKTRTNLIPKASFPITPPTTSPTPTSWPSPSINPTPIPWPSPSVNPSSTPVPPSSPVPSPTATSSASISLAGDTLPNDPRITYKQLDINYPLLENRPEISSYLANYTNSNSLILPIENGYGQFYILYPAAGKKLEILVRELDINTNGSYIETTLYGSDKKKIAGVGSGTRVQFTTENSGPYYLVAHTFDYKMGRVEVTVNDEFRKNLFPYIKRIDKDMELLWDNYDQTGYRIGRKAADYFLQVPQLDGINNEYITFTRQTDQNSLQVTSARVKATQICPLTGQSKDLPIQIERMGSYELNPLRRIQMKIYPQSSAYFPPGYNYEVNLEYPNPNIGWRSHFSTTSQSGVAADLNNDGAVDISDYSLLVSELMQSNNFLLSDLNCDGTVDISDYSLLMSNISL